MCEIILNEENTKQQLNSSKKISVVVIGGGLSGLITSLKLSEKFNVTIIDKQKFLGGLATSINHNGYVMDIGPHILSLPTNSKILDTISMIMPKKELIELTNITNTSKAYFNNKLLNAFPTLSDTLYRSGKIFFIKILCELFLTKIKNKYHTNYHSSKDYLISCYGKNLYDSWFKPFLFSRFFSYDVPLDLIQNLFPPISLRKIVNSLFLNVKPRNLNLISEEKSLHYYFENGMISFIDEIQKKIKSNGGKFILDANIESIIHEKNKKIILSVNDQKQEIPSNVIIYAVPPSITLKWFNTNNEIKQLIEKPTSHLHCIMTFLCINSPKLPFGWIINVYDELVFFRITQQNFLSSSVTPNGKSLLCIEIKCSEESKIWNKSDSELFEIIKNDLKKMDIFDVEMIEEFKVIKLKNLYPAGVSSTRKSDIILSKFFKSFSNEYVLGTIEGDTGRLSNISKDDTSDIGEGGITLAISHADKLIKEIIGKHYS